ncbi:MAG TPA: AgmX/PglI C-terminal domain-containing protein [Polyangiaceae bacterium]|jgi:hypothetical protein
MTISKTYRLLRFPAVSAVLVAFAAACGGSGAPAKDVNATPGEQQQSEHLTRLPTLQSEVGALDPDQVDKAFSDAMPQLKRCFKEGAKRVEFISGSANFFVKVDGSGRIVHAHLEQSSLGDRETEKCMLGALGNRSWPKPQAGETGFFRKSLDFDSSGDTRPPAELSGDFVAKALEEGDTPGRIRECKNGSSGRFNATMYVDTDGHVLAAGMAPPDEQGEAAVDCLVAALKNGTFPSPGSWPAKVTFGL